MTLTKASYAMINGAPYNVLDYGAVADGSTDDYAAIQAAITAAVDAGGGTVYIPSGTYKVDSSLSLDANAMSRPYFNVYIVGAGMGTTVLDFTGTTGTEDGIRVIGWGGRFGISDLTVKNAERHGIYINATNDAASWCHRFHITNVHSDNNGGSGFYLGQCYMADFVGLEASNNASYGFYIGGFSTSLTFEQCWAGGDAAYPVAGNRNSGWYINNTIYSAFIGCGSDYNAGVGFRVTNCSAVTFNGCGTESNTQEGWYISSSSPGSATTQTSGISLNSCFGYNNGTSGRSTYANFLGAVSGSGIDIYMSLTNCTDLNNGNTYSVVFNGASGYVRCDLLNCAFKTTVTKSGSVILYDRTRSGYVATASRLTNTNIPNASDATVQMNYWVTNEINATFTGGGITVPAGVNRVRLTAGVSWNTNSVGYRYMTIYLNGAGFWGNGSLKIPGEGYTQMTTTTAYVDVSQGDYFELRVNQNSGGSLAVLGNDYATFLQMEVIG